MWAVLVGTGAEPAVPLIELVRGTLQVFAQYAPCMGPLLVRLDRDVRSIVEVLNLRLSCLLKLTGCVGRLEVRLQFHCDGLLEVLRLVHRAHISFHQRADGLVHGLGTHLEAVADFDLLD